MPLVTPGPNRRSRKALPAAAVADAELVVLKALWDGGPGTVRELLERLQGAGQQWAYTTVQTLLARLQDKGLVRADRRDLAHVFAAAVTRDQLAGRQVGEVAAALLDGAVAPLVLHLVANGRFSAAEIARFRALLDEAAAGRTGRKTKEPKGKR